VLTLPAKVFSETYFTFWIVIAMMWGICASAVCICLPIYEAREVIYAVCQGKSFAEQQAEDPSTMPDKEMGVAAPVARA
jgi:hypothetical protein